MNDVVSSVVHALENDKIKGLEYSLRGTASYTYDGILDVIAKHCGQSTYTKTKRSLITGYIEKFFIGRTHDKNIMKMFELHETERQNFLNDWSYLTKFNLKETKNLLSTYPAASVKMDNYVKPYLYQYKRISLD